MVYCTTWLLFISVRSRCVVLRVRCPRPLGSHSPPCRLAALCVRCPLPRGTRLLVCPLGVLCCTLGVLENLALVDRCARLVCCVCGVLGHLALVQRCARVVRFVWSAAASCAFVCALWFCPAPSVVARPTLFFLWCVFLGLVVIPWHLVLCGGCGRRRASLACLVAPRWRAVPRPVRSLSMRRSAFPSLWCLPLPRARTPEFPGGCAAISEAGRERSSWCLPLSPAAVGALSSLRVVPVRGHAMGLSLPSPSGVSLGLR